MSQADLIDLCASICALEKSIGSYIIEEQANIMSSSVERKGKIDFVTYVDKEVEKRISSALLNYLPNAGIISEECATKCVSEEYCWVVDPIDGTSNFIHNSGPYCISIALLHNQEPILAVVYELSQNELYYAWAGGKAYMNGRPIQCNSTRILSDTIVGFGFSYSEEKIKSFIPNLSSIAPQSTIRCQGSAAAEICYIAKGIYGAYVHNDLHLWDIAAAALILKQAGGGYCNFQLSSNLMECNSFIAFNNRSILSALLSRINGNSDSLSAHDSVKLYS